MTEYDTDLPRVSGWAVGGVAFAASMMLLIGAFQTIAGIVAILDDEFYVRVANYTFDLDVSAWGWLHLVLGLALLFAAWGLFTLKAWAGLVAIALAVLTAIDQFFFIPYYPFWSILIIALAVWVIWAITRPGALRA
jgi:multisubunit Na+/H+ antiporter MnhG subunit